MSTQYVLGVDIGTQGVKAAIFDFDGKIAGNGFNASELIQPAQGVTEEDPNVQYRNTCDAIRTAIGTGGIDPSEIIAIAMDGQMAGVIGIGEDGEAVTPYDSWLDTRCGPYIKEMRSIAIEEVTTLTGNAPSLNHGPKILWWKHERKETYNRIARFVQPTGYVAIRMAGGSANDAFIDHTYLHFSGFADNVGRRWSEKLLGTFDVSPELMPQIVEPTDQIGVVCEDAARETGLIAGTPIIAGSGDTAASFLAAGAISAGISVDVSGTASVFAATTTELRPDQIDGMLGVGRSAVPGLWHPYSYVNGGGMNLEWYRSMLASIRGGDLSFSELNRLASVVDVNSGLPIFVPHLAGRVSPSDPDMRGAWLGVDWTHTPGALYRAILESIALEYRLYKDRLLELNPDQRVTELRNTGGGNTSALWKQIKADAMDVRVVEVPDFAGATHGVAMIAAVGAGVFSSIADVGRRWVKTGGVTEPRPDQSQYYDERADRYRTALELMHTFVQQKK